MRTARDAPATPEEDDPPAMNIAFPEYAPIPPSVRMDFKPSPKGTTPYSPMYPVAKDTDSVDPSSYDSPGGIWRK
jgi:hypothetical protein